MSNSRELAAIVQVADKIMTEMPDDVAKHEGQPITGALLGQMHGELAATCAALAQLVKALAEIALARG